MVCFVDNILWGGTDEFKAGVINCLGQVFTISSKFSQAFTYLSIEIHQNNDKSITIDQNIYDKAVQSILLTTNQLTEKDVKIPQEDISAFRSLVGQLNWWSGISKPDISFDTPLDITTPLVTFIHTNTETHRHHLLSFLVDTYSDELFKLSFVFIYTDVHTNRHCLLQKLIEIKSNGFVKLFIFLENLFVVVILMFTYEHC